MSAYELQICCVSLQCVKQYFNNLFYTKQLDGVITTPSFTHYGISVQDDGHFVIVDVASCEITVKFDGYSFVSVHVPSSDPPFFGTLTGICGNNDGVANDFVTSDLTDVSGDANKDNMIGDSYQVIPDGSDAPTLA